MGLAKEINSSVVSETLHSPDSSLDESIETALQYIGGLGKFVSKNDSVLLKPNYNTGDPFPASTDTSFLLSVVHLLLKQQVSDVQIIESSTIRANTKKIIADIVGDELQELNVPIVTEKDFEFIKVDLKSKGARYLKAVKLPLRILDPDPGVKIILLPCLKTHFVAHYTGALKLGVGFMERKQRMKMHVSRFVPEKVAELNLGYKPHLIIMDARKIFVTKGPAHGKVESPSKILVGTDRTAVDISGVGIIQSYNANNKLQNKHPHEVRTIRRAKELIIV
ncbi:MAG: DUF362 domain-containing protein [Candidatus Hodarchaeales archaeon]